MSEGGSDFRAQAGKAVRSVRSVFDDGVGMTPYIGAMREAVNDYVLGTASTVQTDLSGRVKTLRHFAGSNWQLAAPYLRSVQEMGEKHPGVLLGATVVCVGVPSLLIGKRAAVLNSVLAASGGAGAMYLAKRQ